MKIDLCKEDCIDYKIVNNGTGSVTDSELVSIIIGEKIPEKARELLRSANNNLFEFGRTSYHDLKKAGVTHAKAVCLMASIELGRRRKLEDSQPIYQIKCSKDVSDIFQPLLSDLPHEEFWVLFLNRSNRIINRMKVSQGGINGTVTDVRIVMKKAIEYLASGIIVCHNHPSGNLNPSENDTRITQKIKQAGDIVDIQLMDHIIISGKEFYSFADNGLL